MNYPMIENADEKLREICVEGINEKYGEPLKNTAMCRLEQELSIVEKQGSASGYLTVINALRAAQVEASELFFCGCIASSVLAYAAGLSDLEPLTCVPKLYSEFHFGLHGERHPAFEVRVTKENHDRLLQYFENYPGPEKITKRVDEFGTVFGVTIGETDKNEIGELFRMNIIPGDDVAISADEEITGEILEACAPESDADYVKCLGLRHSTGAWRDNAEILVREGTAPLKDLIANREDVYEFLMEHGVERDKAFEIAEFVRKGRAKRRGWKDGMLETMQEAGIPAWYINSCEKIGYLFTRAHLYLFFRKYISSMMVNGIFGLSFRP
ncbi:MAG: hypothetical protein K6G16_05890 [Lachnospiraceae bacterium]|nr:hypothetical protein [Lachnospiraceae bacterium]